MLTHEQAQAALNNLYNPNWQSDRLAKVKNIPDSLKTIAWGLLGCHQRGKSLDYGKAYQVRHQTALELNRLSPPERIEIFTLLFPQFAEIVEKAWQLLCQLPYQEHHYRRSFRVANHPEIFDSKRANWFLRLLEICQYEQDLVWYAVWTPYLNFYAGETLGILFAAAINKQDNLGQEIFSILVAAAKGEHDIAAMGRHVTRGLLVASNSEGWQVIENLLIAAQRQEGLRQVILETVDEAHPQAFQRILTLIVEQDLTRFSATIRAVDVWFSLGWDAVKSKVVQESLATVVKLLDSQKYLQETLASSDPESVYFALWVLGFQNALDAIPVASNLLNHPDASYRFVAVYFLSQLHLPESQIALITALEDQDLRVATQAVIALTYTNEIVKNTELFEKLEAVINNFPEKPKTLTPLVWDWLSLEASQEKVLTTLFNNLGERSPQVLLPYISQLNPYQRRDLAQKLAEIKPWNEEIRNALFKLVSDASSWVREEALKCFHGCEIQEREAIALEKLLTRKSADLRRGILQLLLKQTDKFALDSAQRLLSAKAALQKQAGLELLKELKSQNRVISDCVNYAQNYQAKTNKLSEVDSQLLEKLLENELPEASLEDALGLVNFNNLTPYIEPQVKHNYKFVTSTTAPILQSLDELIHQHRHTPITLKTYAGSQEELLGNCQDIFWVDPNLSPEENLENFPLGEIWEKWLEERGDKLRDKDGLELIRSLASVYTPSPSNWLNSSVKNYTQSPWWQKVRKTLFVDTDNLRYPLLIRSILLGLLYPRTPDNLLDFLLAATATTLTLIPFQELTNSEQTIFIASELQNSLCGWVRLTAYYRHLVDCTDGEKLEFWQLSRWSEQFSYLSPFYSPNKLADFALAYRLGGATQDDIIDYLLGCRHPHPQQNRQFYELGNLTARKLPTHLDPILKEIGDRCRQRILEIELRRGDLPTAASAAALALRSLVGIPHLIRLLLMMGKDKLIRGYSYHNLSKPAVFSHLIRVSFPDIAETPQDFAEAVETAQIPEQKLIELAFYAPQWSNYVEKALNWPDCTEAIWWIHAHTKDNQWHVDKEVREDWAVQVSERTPLSEQNLIDGAVDVEWFFRIYPSLQGQSWKKLYEAAKYASSGAGHKRAQLFAAAMLGEIDKATLIKKITEKRHQDAVRALGLLPLENDILQRYQIIQEFSRSSRQFGSQRQASEKLAALIGIENLSRTAGYPDPQRLEWAMEAEAIADLIAKPLTITREEVSISLSITTDGTPEITITKAAKKLKSIPASLKKDPEIISLQNRKQDLTRQAARMRLSLEAAMNRGDKFSRSEFQQLCQHPTLAPMLEKLIFIGAENSGYPVDKGQALRLHTGEIKPVTSKYLQIAHPYHLLQTKEWHLWQQDCFNQQFTQPFKQIFREIYLLTSAESQNYHLSRRYEGQQINPKQAFALWGKLGWITCPEEGIRRTFHQENISAWVTFINGFYTPLELEGLTIEAVYFSRRGEYKPLPLTEITPVIFSEVMRDIDLIVSVAHLGGIDPEASSSTMEMRGALIGESCRLLKLDNVQVQQSHALIEGHLGSYSIHLGSAVVHRQPGGALCILPVHSSQRGRLFLPFADDDPKTAEIISKVLLLAKDWEIKDPSILEQIL